MNSEITLLRLKSGMFRDKDINNLCTSANKLCSIPLYSYIKPNCSLEDCLEVTRTLIDEKQIQLLIIDDFDFFEELLVPGDFDHSVTGEKSQKVTRENDQKSHLTPLIIQFPEDCQKQFLPFL